MRIYSKFLQMIMILAAVFVFAAGSRGEGPGPVGPMPLSRLHSEGGYLIDGYGRVTLLRGANVPSHVYKPMKFGPADLDALTKFGFNFIRLGISWDKVEPREGELDLPYLRSYVDFARLAGQRGIYVLPEVHKYGWCQEGSDWPTWTCKAPVKNGGDFIAQIRNARDFWASPELQQKLISFWKVLVIEFRDLDNVAGYEPMNEPLDASMFIPGLFEKKLMPFYERWLEAVRELDPERTAFLEPCTANMIVPFKHPPFNYPNLVYAPHPYYMHVSVNGRDWKEPETARGLEKKYRRNAQEARELNAPLLAGEFGGDPETRFARDWLTKSLDLQDQYFASAAIWVYDNADQGWAITDAHQEPKPFFYDVLRRPYPRHTAGRPLELKYDVEARVFTYRFVPDPRIQAPTEIFAPRDLASGKITVTGATFSYDPGQQLLLIIPERGAAEVGIQIGIEK